MAQTCHHDPVSCNFRKSIGLTTDELQRMDIAYQGPSSKFDEEKIMVENGYFVAQTAVIKDNQLRPIEGNFPIGYAISESLADIV